ncbi:MAG: ankyrin repeat domain-containing protein [Gammaproteobacteria bacterium]
MVELKILLFAPNHPDYPKTCQFFRAFHYSHHIEIVIKDLSTKKMAHINYASRPIRLWQEDEEKSIGNRGAVSDITLYSEGSFDEFVSAFFHTKFADYQNYNYAFNNCSDAVKFALDFFFPTKALNAFYTTYQTAFCWLYLGIHGVKYFPVPPGINSPFDVMNRARLLELYFRKPRERTVPEIKAVESKQQCVKKLKYQDEALMLAIDNNHDDSINHFLEYHLDEFSPEQLHAGFKYIDHGKAIDYLIRALERMTPELVNRAVKDLIRRKNTDLLRLLFSHIHLFTMQTRGEILNYLVESQDEGLLPVLEQINGQFSQTQLSRALMCAVQCENPDRKLIAFLCECESGAKLDFENKNQDSVLSLAIRNEYYAIVQYFIDEMGDRFSISQLHFALLKLIAVKEYELAEKVCIKIQSLTPSEFKHDKKTGLFESREKRYARMGEMLITHHARQLPFNRVGEILHSLIFTNQYELALHLLRHRPGIGMYISDFHRGYAIHTALRYCDPDMSLIRYLCESGQNTVLKLADNNGDTALSLAIKNYSSAAIDYLLPKFEDQFTLDQLHDALCVAIKKSPSAAKQNADIIKYLLERYWDKFSFDQFGLILHCLIIAGQNESALQLLQRKPGLGMYKNASGNYAIHVALTQYKANMQLIMYLCESGVHTTLKATACGDHTVLSTAIEHSHNDVANYFLTKYTDQFTHAQLRFALSTAIQKHNHEMSCLIMTRLWDKLSLKELGEILRESIRKDDSSTAKYILRKNAYAAMYGDANKNYPIHIAALQFVDAELIQLLLKEGASTLLQIKDNYGETALMLAIRYSNHTMVDYLIENHAKHFTLDQLRYALLALIINNAEKQALALIKKVPKLLDINLQLTEKIDWRAVGISVLNHCVLNIEPMQLGYLLLNSILNKKDNIAKYILTARKDSRQDWTENPEDKNTAIHCVLNRDTVDLELVRLLCESGAVPNKKNSAGEHALSIAMKKNLTDVITYLVENHSKSFLYGEIVKARARLEKTPPIIFHLAKKS